MFRRDQNSQEFPQEEFQPIVRCLYCGKPYLRGQGDCTSHKRHLTRHRKRGDKTMAERQQEKLKRKELELREEADHKEAIARSLRSADLELE
jgi:hypothetical protein